MALFAIPFIPTLISLSAAAATLLTSKSVNSSDNSEISEGHSDFEKFQADAGRCGSNTRCIAEAVTQNPDAFTQEQHHWLFQWHYRNALHEAETKFYSFYSDSEPLMMAHYRALSLGTHIEINGLFEGIDEYLTHKSFFDKRIHLLNQYSKTPANPPRQNDMNQPVPEIKEIEPERPEEKNYISLL